MSALGPNRDATFAAFRREYHLNLSECVKTMPVVDLVALINGLDSWGPHQENTARLFEVQSYQLELDWVTRTVDPNDPEVRKERLEAERSGIKPPKHPIVPPIALRPPEWADERIASYMEEITAQIVPERERLLVSPDEFDAALGLDD